MAANKTQTMQVDKVAPVSEVQPKEKTPPPPQEDENVLEDLFEHKDDKEKDDEEQQASIEETEVLEITKDQISKKRGREEVEEAEGKQKMRKITTSLRRTSTRGANFVLPCAQTPSPPHPAKGESSTPQVQKTATKKLRVE